MLQTVEQETGASPQWSVIWLHGLGADGHDFAPIVPELVRPHWPALRFVFPHAPVRPITINNGVPMRGWYAIAATALRSRADLARRSLHVLLAQRLRHVVRGDVQGVHAVRTQPDAHAVVARAKHLHLTDARQARQRLTHLGAGVVTDEQRRVGIVR